MRCVGAVPNVEKNTNIVCIVTVCRLPAVDDDGRSSTSTAHADPAVRVRVRWVASHDDLYGSNLSVLPYVSVCVCVCVRVNVRVAAVPPLMAAWVPLPALQ